jgi:bifunctional DNA-binding transcriptional regulator/antitoxin component of YhaV-PrlF toxin-antitoxin module
MSSRATINSKGRITLTVSVRHQMGLRDGDVLEFTLENGVTTMQRFAPDSNPFIKWAGRLTGQERLEDAVEWQRDLRDEN